MKPDRTISRRERRILCMLTASVTFIFYKEVLDSQVPESIRWLGLAVLALLCFFLFVSTRGFAFRSAERLDERELQVSLRAHQRGYGTAIGLFMGSVLYQFIALNPLAFKPNITLTLADLVYLFGFIVMMPTFVVAWTEPDPLTELRTV